MAYLQRHAASPTSESRNMLCSSAYATEVGARSWLKSGEGMRMLAKCAAWPASCMRVVRPVRPEPIAAGSAREVKCVTVGCHEPSALTHAGCGQWQKPLEYLPLRSRRSRLIEAPSYVIPSAAKERPHCSTERSKGKYGSRRLVTSPAIRKPVFHGSSADAPLSAASFSRAATISGRVPCSRVSRIWKRAALPKPSACVTL
mmetsp:Transcript_32910/g.83851  ORF Transcript_32910/g.83851 Transcript_32910/m.83851 type:complete len:201 (-) Transcript_32910:630-1232(-)